MALWYKGSSKTKSVSGAAYLLLVPPLCTVQEIDPDSSDMSPSLLQDDLPAQCT